MPEGASIAEGGAMGVWGVGCGVETLVLVTPAPGEKWVCCVGDTLCRYMGPGTRGQSIQVSLSKLGDGRG